jgi:4'-phosphopantetheinyl transferase
MPKNNKGDSLFDRLQREIHIWFLRPESVQNPDTLDHLRSILSKTELSQYQRYLFPEHAHLYLVSHGLVRRVLSKYAGIDPHEWAFRRTAHGRPEIDVPDIPALRFNLTHTPGLAACIVTLEDACGIDAEHLVARGNLLGVAERMFSEAEYRELEQLESDAFLEFFFTRWTLREAYVKARGIGIYFPTRKMNFTVNSDTSIEASFHPELEDNAEIWNFQILKPTDSHIVSVAVSDDAEIKKAVISRTLEL